MRKEAPSVHFSDLPFDGVYNYNSHVAAHGPFSHLLTQQEGKATAKRCARSLSLSLSPAHLKVTAWWHVPLGGTSLNTSAPQLGPGLSQVCLPSQPLRVISCFSSRGLALGKAGVVPTASHWFPSVQRQALWLSPSAREHVSHSP